jgi:bidirectional [NiFe] hydrogenase diaphorase subunit
MSLSLKPSPNTPANAKVVTLRIDDQDVSGHDNQTVLEVAREHEIFIPTLCHLEGLTPIGACRLCLVEVTGSAQLQAACAIAVREGMEVFTRSERLDSYRKLIVEMLFTEGNHICSVCVANGHCDLQTAADYVGVDYVRLPYRYPRRFVDATHERFTFDPNRCILCTRCVRVCDEVEGAHTWDVMGRGIESHLITDMNDSWGDSLTCTTCGKCVQVCPTGALFVKGRSVAEQAKRCEFLPYLNTMRRRRNP